MSITWAPFSVSRLPVGSSARISAGLADDGAGDGGALLLAAGELVRIVAGAVGDADPVHRRLDPGLAVLAAPSGGR